LQNEILRGRRRRRRGRRRRKEGRKEEMEKEAVFFPSLASQQ